MILIADCSSRRVVLMVISLILAVSIRLRRYRRYCSIWNSCSVKSNWWSDSELRYRRMDLWPQNRHLFWWKCLKPKQSPPLDFGIWNRRRNTWRHQRFNQIAGECAMGKIWSESGDQLPKGVSHSAFLRFVPMVLCTVVINTETLEWEVSVTSTVCVFMVWCRFLLADLSSWLHEKIRNTSFPSKFMRMSCEWLIDFLQIALRSEWHYTSVSLKTN